MRAEMLRSLACDTSGDGTVALADRRPVFIFAKLSFGIFAKLSFGC
jgi:hypothetical protein